MSVNRNVTVPAQPPPTPLTLTTSRGRFPVTAAATTPGASACRAASTSATDARPRAAATNSSRTGPVQAQRAGQQHGGVLAGRAVDAPLQVTDRPRAQARCLGQLLLRQPGLAPQLPQQPGERKRRLLRHRPSVPRTRSANPVLNSTQPRSLPLSLADRPGYGTAAPGTRTLQNRSRSALTARDAHPAPGDHRAGTSAHGFLWAVLWGGSVMCGGHRRDRQ